MKKYLVVVDMQKDFVDGSLGTREAVAIVPNVAAKIRGFEGTIFVTMDTHPGNYLETHEGRRLPVEHCIRGTAGWELDPAVTEALSGKQYTVVEKPGFGSSALPVLIRENAGTEPFEIELIGLCTDICVVSNALSMRVNFPEADIAVDSSCCAGVTPEAHEAALATMRQCQIDIE